MMADFSKWNRDNLERVANEMLARLVSRPSDEPELLHLLLMRAYVKQQQEDSESEQITSEWLESIGFLQDGDDKGNKEYGKRAWSLSHLENSDDDRANMIQVLVSAKDHSVWLEVYDNGGDSLALIEVPGGTQERVVRLCEALGIEATQRDDVMIKGN